MGIKILLADDSVTAQNMGKKILSDAGHEVVTVSNGAAAAKKIAEIKPELVLLDVFMPGYSGLELCEKLRNAAETSKLPVLLTVGRMEPYNSQDGARVKADGVIVKPFEASDLTAAVDRLADKLKLKQQPGTSGSGITVVAKNETAQPELSNKQETTAVTTTSLTPVSEESKGYEKTVALNPAHIESVLKTGAASPEQEFAVPAREQVAEDFRVAPAMTAADVYSLDHSQSGTETKPQPPRASVPSYMAQYLAEPEAASAPASAHETLLDPAASAGPASPTVHDQPTSAFPIPNEFLLSHSRNEINEIDFSKEIRDEAPVGSIPGLEFTAAPPVPDVPIASEPGLELTLQPAEPGTGIVQDPALVTDPHHSKMDFPTRFGSSESELAQQFIDSLHASAEPVVDETDEFEARLGAAMASYEEPSAELPSAAEEPTSNVVEIRSRFTSEAAPATQRLEPQVDTSIHFDRPEVGSQPVAVRPGNPLDVPPVEVSDVNAVRSEIEFERPSPEFDLSSTTGHSAPPTPDYLHRVESVSSSATTPLDAAETADIADIAAQVLAPETDDSVIQQMREGLSHLPIESVHHGEGSEAAPLAMAAAASAAPGPMSPPRDPESEVARAMAAAMGRELPTEYLDPPSGEVREMDANTLAGAVETVMKRELPSLIWKIMAELDLRKRT